MRNMKYCGRHEASGLTSTAIVSMECGPCTALQYFIFWRLVRIGGRRSQKHDFGIGGRRMSRRISIYKEVRSSSLECLSVP